MDALRRARLGQVAEHHPARPVAEPGAAVARDKARLAAATRADDGQQPSPGVEPLRERAQLGGTADERIALGDEVVSHVAQRAPEFTVADDAIRLFGVRRWRERTQPVHAELEQFDRLVDALQSIVAVALEFGPVGQAGASQRGARRRAEQGLPARRERHHARRERFGQALDLDRLGAARHVGGSVLPQRDRAVVDADADRESERLRRALVADSEVRGVGDLVEIRKKPSVRSISRPPLRQQARAARS
jgi:hypothetical protein